ncbi:MAG: ABC transporter ATP-binding protein [Bacteroidetes bacterium]|nr:ABC transporter ATP-binding protein [Bacteroidota bacterium]
MIQVHNLCKQYHGHLVLKGIDFTIQKGEFYGLLGPNGAGKTTTISILSNLLQADEGDIQIAGFDLKKQSRACKQSIGVVPQEIALYEELSAWDNLLFWGSLYDVPTKLLKSRINETLELFGLTERKQDKIKTYSGGMKRRVNIASAILHQPKVLFMDEPTVGIDPQSRNLIYEVIEKLHKEGLTFLYTTHYMEEAERFCTKIGVIDDGKIIAEGSLSELKKLGNVSETIEIKFNEVSDLALVKLKEFWPKGDYSNSQKFLFYSTEVHQDLAKIILKCNDLGLDILHIEIQKVNLESVFLQLTGKQLRDA